MKDVSEDARNRRLLGLTRNRVQKFAQDSGVPLVAGPWLGEIAFELLYWLPFLQWVVAEFPTLRQRIVVVSRGGAGAWYQDIAWRYFDLFELFTMQEFRERFPKFIKQTPRYRDYERLQYPKAESDVVELVRQQLGCQRVNVLQPSEMYVSFKFLEKTDPHWISKCYRRLPAPTLTGLGLSLPRYYVAVRFYNNLSLPMTDAHHEFVRSTIQYLSAEIPVVLLTTGAQYDLKHKDFPVELSSSVLAVSEFMTPGNNLAIQSAVLGNARAFCGNYGGLSFLPPYYDCPVFAVFGNASAAKLRHRKFASKVFAKPGLGGYWSGSLKDMTSRACADRVLEMC